jgi:hypothetical protein
VATRQFLTPGIQENAIFAIEKGLVKGFQANYREIPFDVPLFRPQEFA